MTLLKQILSVRSYREARAQATVRAQVQVVDQATATRHKAEEALVSFRTMAQAREAQWIGELCGKTVRLREISEVNAAIGELRLQTLQRSQVLDQAGQSLAQALESLEKCRADHAAVWRLEQRFVEFVKRDTEGRVQALERREEAELSEASELTGRRLNPSDPAGGRDA